MNYDFPAELHELIQRQLDSGAFDSEEAVLVAALHSLEQQQTELAAIGEGIDDMEAGRIRHLRDFDREFRERRNLPQDA
jgi:Arc/MetJ-type ribon-helix-helix transcriptional regulator